jgi:hypothetical protein
MTIVTVGIDLAKNVFAVPSKANGRAGARPRTMTHTGASTTEP